MPVLSRTRTPCGVVTVPNCISALARSPEPPCVSQWSGEEYLTPVLQDDCLLFGFEEEDEMETELAPTPSPALVAEDLPQELALPVQVAHLQARHAALAAEVRRAQVHARSTDDNGQVSREMEVHGAQ